MMGGAASHEFMAIADCGEDTLFCCTKCDYRANKEIAKTGLKFQNNSQNPLEKIHTPGLKTIEELAQFLKVDASQTGKAVFYSNDKGELYFVVIRGDLEVNETKLRNSLKAPDLKFANDEQIKSIGAVPGFASPYGLDLTKIHAIFDPSAAESSNLVVGANITDYHYLGFNFDRDISQKDKVKTIDIAAARDGDPCPSCSAPLKQERGIEVGNIFQLGIKYSKAMNCTYLDQNGKSQIAIMGCYGIGVGRSMAAVIEQSHDKFGPIWPIEIAPYHVHLCALNYNDPSVKSAADQLYTDLLDRGIEVLFDDRNEKAGSMFNDADLIGCPLKVILSQKGLATNSAELKDRKGELKEVVPFSNVMTAIQSYLKSFAK
jgi:prolyl-tRNA synthetase